jgi:hypothetical protein
MTRIKPPEKQRVSHFPFLKINDPLYAYLLGLFWADGHVEKAHNKIALISTKPDCDHFKKIIEKSGDWGFYLYKTIWKDRFEASTSNFYLKNLLVELGFQEKDKGFERVFSHLTEKFVPAFLLGLSDGDGCFCSNESKSSYRFSLCGQKNQNWDAIINLLVSLGVKHKVETFSGKNGSFSKIHINGKFMIKKFGEHIYNNNVTLGLPRKYQAFLLALKSCEFLRAPRGHKKRVEAQRALESQIVNSSGISSS